MAGPRYFRVKGRVQGVSFRAAARDTARQLALRGWVSNRSDGDVELVASGDDDDIARLREWLAHGPNAARVTEVEETACDEASLPAGFDIR